MYVAPKPKSDHPFGETITDKLVRPGIAAAIKRADSNGKKEQTVFRTVTIEGAFQETIQVFQTLAASGCTCLVFGNIKITIETV
jgi:hypothetical protein